MLPKVSFVYWVHAASGQELMLSTEKKKGTDTPSTNSAAPSPGPLVNPIDENLRDSFPTGRPLEDPAQTVKCTICKKAFLQTAYSKHHKECTRLKAERLRKKKEAKEAKDREKREEKKEADKDDEGDTKMEDDDDNEEEPSPEKKGPGGLKSAKKSAGKKVDGEEKKGKKRKAEGDAEKGPKQKKKKEEPKPKVPKARGKVAHL